MRVRAPPLACPPHSHRTDDSLLCLQAAMQALADTHCRRPGPPPGADAFSESSARVEEGDRGSLASEQYIELVPRAGLLCSFTLPPSWGSRQFTGAHARRGEPKLTGGDTDFERGYPAATLALVADSERWARCQRRYVSQLRTGRG